MRQIRYQIFISSTFRDLRAERQAVLDAILNIGHFPAGMELFPASDATPWEIIQRVIDDSDYYVLVVGGMYGSTDSSGIGYTEKEYDYAKSQGKPVLAFLHENPDAIPAGKTESQADARKKLAAFRNKLQKHHCKYWREAQDLQYKVAVGLVQELNRNPATGWVRASDLANSESAMQALAEVEIATNEAALQSRLRDDAERRAQSLEKALSTLEEQHARARAEIEASAAREATAIAQERMAKEAVGQDESESEPGLLAVPESFDLTAAEELLDGKYDKIDAFVIWRDTPQGTSFWVREQDRLENGKELSAEAREAILSLIKRAPRTSSTDATDDSK